VRFQSRRPQPRRAWRALRPSCAPPCAFDGVTRPEHGATSRRLGRSVPLPAQNRRMRFRTVSCGVRFRRVGHQMVPQPLTGGTSTVLHGRHAACIPLSNVSRT
jgi:hypothetical protein